MSYDSFGASLRKPVSDETSSIWQSGLQALRDDLSANALERTAELAAGTAVATGLIIAGRQFKVGTKLGEFVESTGSVVKDTWTAWRSKVSNLSTKVDFGRLLERSGLATKVDDSISGLKHDGVAGLDQSTSLHVEASIDAAKVAPPRGLTFVQAQAEGTDLSHVDYALGLEKVPDTKAQFLQAKPGGSLTRVALGLEKNQLPQDGHVVAIGDFSTDTLNALSILALRSKGIKFDQPFARMVVHGTEDPALYFRNEGVRAIKSVKISDQTSLDEGVGFIKAVLSDKADKELVHAKAIEFERTEYAGKGTGIGGLTSVLSHQFTMQGTPNQFRFVLGLSGGGGEKGLVSANSAENVVRDALRKSMSGITSSPGTDVLVTILDANHVVAGAVVEARTAKVPVRKDLLELFGDKPPTDRSLVNPDLLAAYDAIQGFSNAWYIKPEQKIAAAEYLITHDVHAGELQGLIRDFEIFDPTKQPYRAVVPRIDFPLRFDHGIEITNAKILRGRPNLDHHGRNAAKLSAAEQALEMPIERVPQPGSTLGFQKIDADALTAAAVWSNRVAGNHINEDVVRAIGRYDRGLDRAPGLVRAPEIERSFRGIRSIAGNESMLVEQKINAARAILADEVPMSTMKRISARFEWRNAQRMEKATAEAHVYDEVPNQLSLVVTRLGNVFHGRDLGLSRAPVTVVAAKRPGGVHYNVVARPEGADMVGLAQALSELNRIEHGWDGRPNIFVSPHRSKLDPDDVLSVLKRNLGIQLKI